MSSENINKVKHPTLAQVQKELDGFEHSLVMYVYHHMNGRKDEADSYLEEWKEQQEMLKTKLQPMENVGIDYTSKTDEHNIGEHVASDSDGNAEVA
jgi:hypothetical protein